MAAEVTSGRSPAGVGSRAMPALRWLGRLRGDRVLPGVALIAAVVLVLVETPLVAAPKLPLPIAFAIVIVHVGAVPMALRIPNIAAPLSLAAALALQALSADTASLLWPWSPVLIVTQCLVLGAVAARRTLPVALLHWVLAVVSSASLSAVLRPTRGDETSVDVAVFGSISAALILVALLGTQWRRVRSELLHEREVAATEAERRLVAEERTRIARELHDVVAHSLSIITVQSSTARFRHTEFSEEAGAEFDRIAAQSRQALEEMRGLLRVLRESDSDAERRPQPGLHDVAELVRQANDAGMTVALDEPDGPWTAGVGPLTGLAAYRIVQEATSNALRHAPGSAVSIVLRRVADDIELTVTDAGSPHAERSSGRPGHGLVGMTERAASVGGAVRYGPEEGGGFSVHARLPVFPRAGAAVTVRVLVVDDQAMVRAGFAALLDAQPDLEVVGQAADGDEAVRLVLETRPEVVLMDVRMPVMDGIEATKAMLAPDRPKPTPKVVVLTTFDVDDYVLDALRAGASGFLLKDALPADLVEAVRVVARGDALLAPSVTRRLIERFAARPTGRTAIGSDLDVLTEREREVLREIAQGRSNSEIAAVLFIAEQTVKSHVSRVLTKLGLRDRAQAVVVAYESGLVVPGD